MNKPTAILAADGRARRAFTVREVVRMQEAGVVGPDERLEVVDGELLPTSPKGARHEVLKRRLLRHLVLAAPDALAVVPEAGWQLDEMLYLEPDLLVFPETVPFADVRGADALLVVEIADSTLGYDLGRKPALYADAGVREYWVVDAVTRETHVHLNPVRGGYADVRAYGPEIALRPTLAPALAVRLADLPAT
jgi:Uma2 family endonuclease